MLALTWTLLPLMIVITFLPASSPIRPSSYPDQQLPAIGAVIVMVPSALHLRPVAAGRFDGLLAQLHS